MVCTEVVTLHSMLSFPCTFSHLACLYSVLTILPHRQSSWSAPSTFGFSFLLSLRPSTSPEQLLVAPATATPKHHPKDLSACHNSIKHTEIFFLSENTHTKKKKSVFQSQPSLKGSTKLSINITNLWHPPTLRWGQIAAAFMFGKKTLSHTYSIHTHKHLDTHKCVFINLTETHVCSIMEWRPTYICSKIIKAVCSARTYVNVLFRLAT